MNIDKNKIYTLNSHHMIVSGDLDIAKDVKAEWKIPPSIKDAARETKGFLSVLSDEQIRNLTMSINTLDLKGSLDEIFIMNTNMLINILASVYFDADYDTPKLDEFRKTLISKL